MTTRSISRPSTLATENVNTKSVTRLAPGMHTADAVAARLNTTRRRIYILAAGGALPCVRLGGQIRFNGETIEHWIANGGSGYPDSGK